MPAVYIIIAVVIVLVLAYVFILRPRIDRRGVIKVFGYGNMEGNYLWTGYVTSKGALLYAPDDKNLAEGQHADRIVKVLKAADGSVTLDSSYGSRKQAASAEEATAANAKLEADGKKLEWGYMVYDPRIWKKAGKAPVSDNWPL